MDRLLSLQSLVISRCTELFTHLLNADQSFSLFICVINFVQLLTTISSPPGLGSTVSTIGTADGNLNGTTGGVVGGSFATAPLTISGTISTASLNAPGTILSLSATGATGSITLPNSILAVTPTPTPTPTPLKTLTNEQSKVIIVALLKSDEEIGRRRDRGNFRSRRSSLGQSRISGYLSTVIFGMIDGFDQQD